MLFRDSFAATHIFDKNDIKGGELSESILGLVLREENARSKIAHMPLSLLLTFRYVFIMLDLI